MLFPLEENSVIMLCSLHCRNMVDYPHDNMLDPGEFGIAMHLIQAFILNRQLPRKLPESLRPEYREEVHIPTMTSREHRAYRRLFQKTVDKNNAGKLKGLLDFPLYFILWAFFFLNNPVKGGLIFRLSPARVYHIQACRFCIKHHLSQTSELRVSLKLTQ